MSDPLLSPRGSHLAALSATQETLIVWDVTTRARLCELPAGVIDLPYTRFSPDGSLLAVQTNGGAVTLRETATGSVAARRAPPPGSRIQTSDVSFDAEGKRLAFESRDTSDHFILAVLSANGHVLASESFADGCASVAFSPDGMLLAVGLEQRNILILDAATLAIRGTLYGHGDWVTALAFSPDGKYLASSSQDDTTRIWDYANSEQMRVLTGGASSLAFSADNTLLAGGSSTGARVWAWQHHARAVLHGHERHVYYVAFSPDPGEPGLIASSAWDDTVRLWDALTGAPLAVLPTRYPWVAMGFTPDGSRLLVRDPSDEYGIAVWVPATGTRLRSPRTASDTELFEILGQQDVDWPHRFVRLVQGDVRHEGLVSSHDGKLLAEVTNTGVQVIDQTTGDQVIELSGQPTKYSAIAFNPDGTKLALCLEELGATVWDLATGARLASLTGHVGNVYAFAFSPDGSRLVSGGNDGNIIIWCAESFELLAILRGHQSYVYSVAFSPDGTMLASASGDGTARIWDSLRAAERWRQIQQAVALRRQAKPLIDRLLENLGDPLDVAERLRNDAALDDASRRAALRVLLQRSESGSRGSP